MSVKAQKLYSQCNDVWRECYAYEIRRTMDSTRHFQLCPFSNIYFIPDSTSFRKLQ